MSWRICIVAPFSQQSDELKGDAWGPIVLPRPSRLNHLIGGVAVGESTPYRLLSGIGER